MPLKLCQATLSCGNYAAIDMGGESICVRHGAERDLKTLLRERTTEQLNHLAVAGCGELPIWAQFGLPREPMQTPDPKRLVGRPRKWRTANERWLAWSWRKKGWIVRKAARPKTAPWIGVSDRERNTILNREWKETTRQIKKPKRRYRPSSNSALRKRGFGGGEEISG
jgi:hypothetical protein